MKIEIFATVTLGEFSHENVCLEVEDDSIDSLNEKIYDEYFADDDEDGELSYDDIEIKVTDWNGWDDLGDLETVCEYSSYSGYYEDDQDLIIAAYKCDVQPEDINEAYSGQFDSDEDFAEDLLDSCGDLPRNLPGYIHIDWERTARDIMMDYSEDGGYYFRCL